MALIPPIIRVILDPTPHLLCKMNQSYTNIINGKINATNPSLPLEIHMGRWESYLKKAPNDSKTLGVNKKNSLK